MWWSRAAQRSSVPPAGSQPEYLVNSTRTRGRAPTTPLGTSRRCSTALASLHRPTSARSWCSALTLTRPSRRIEVDPSTGLNRFALEPDAVNHTLWAACQETHSALAWQLEQGALLSLLALQSGDQSSEQATLLKEQLQEAASEVSDRLLGTTGGVGLAARALQRAQRLAELVDPSTAPAPVDGSGHLPVSLQDLASAIESLAEAAQEAPCSGAATDWATLHGKVVDELTQQAEVSAAVNASSLLDPAGFDYAQRATEAVAVGAAVALQAGALAALAEFNCLARYDPFNAAIREGDLSDLQTAAYTLLQRLCAALPLPAVGTAASAPVQEDVSPSASRRQPRPCSLPIAPRRCSCCLWTSVAACSTPRRTWLPRSARTPRRGGGDPRGRRPGLSVHRRRAAAHLRGRNRLSPT
ncbi:unnamed protein product [Prorocentrum cordatum]|uniref:Uncharacterized protein n=1 Tax=Prorocentrum cordatum TaxID=2364126 RepID=A0ABN9TEM4_9DINO|nr:unnamed protein product [Polarella glacialis]